jgi:hypothetical protein
MRGNGGGSTASLSSPELGMAGACCPCVQVEPYPFYRHRQMEESKLGRASWGRANGMAWARGQGTASGDAVWAAWRRGVGGAAWRAEKKPGRSGFGSTRGRGVVLAGGAARGRDRWRRRRMARL